VLSVRCGTGNLLTVVQPAEGKGIDICPEIVEIAQQRNPSLEVAVAFPDKEEFALFQPEENSIISCLTISRHGRCPSSAAQFKAALSKTYPHIGDHLQSSLGTARHVCRMDWNEGPTHGAELAFDV